MQGFVCESHFSARMQQTTAWSKKSKAQIAAVHKYMGSGGSDYYSWNGKGEHSWQHTPTVVDHNTVDNAAMLSQQVVPHQPPGLGSSYTGPVGDKSTPPIRAMVPFEDGAVYIGDVQLTPILQVAWASWDYDENINGSGNKKRRKNAACGEFKDIIADGHLLPFLNRVRISRRLYDEYQEWKRGLQNPSVSTEYVLGTRAYQLIFMQGKIIQQCVFTENAKAGRLRSARFSFVEYDAAFAGPEYVGDFDATLPFPRNPNQLSELTEC